MTKKILYLDRDGIINEHIPYVGTLERFHIINEIFQISKFFNQKGFSIIVVTNQSGIERGFYSLLDFYILSEHMAKEFQKHDIDIEVRACPHLPERNCHCRKPKTYMLRDKRSLEDIFIGDQESDMLAAKKANINNRWLISKNLKSKYETNLFHSHSELIHYLGIF